MATSRKHKVVPYGVDIVTGGLGSELSKLFRTILHDNGVDAERYNDLMYWYIVREQAKANRNERAEARMGLSQELMKEAMTWKTFIKGLKFLHIDTFELGLTLTLEGAEPSSKPVFLQLKSKLSNYTHPGEILGELFQLLQTHQGITPQMHEELLHGYIEKTRGHQSRKDKAAARASLNKELQKTVMSWRTFIKGLVFHRTVKYMLSITLFRRLKPPTQHSVVVNLDDYTETSDEGDE